MIQERHRRRRRLFSLAALGGAMTMAALSPPMFAGSPAATQQPTGGAHPVAAGPGSGSQPASWTTSSETQGMSPGVPGRCGCEDLPQEYPDYTITYDTYDAEADTWDQESRTITHRTVETAHFAIHYPDSTSRAAPSAGSGSVQHTTCRWDWGIDDVKNFGQDGFIVDCLAEESFANSLAPRLETIWSAEIGMGYPEPDAPDGRIHVYVGNLEKLLELDVAAAAEPCASDSPGGPTHSRLFVDSTGAMAGNMEGALAHELFHIIQNGIDHKEGLAWTESTALWMQNMITGNADWGYFEMGIQNYARPLTDVADPWAIRYAQIVWPEFLATHYGPEIIRDIWLEADTTAGDDGMGPAYTLLSSEIDGYQAAIHQFRYDLWAAQGAPVTATYALSPTSSQVVEEFEIQETAANYIEFQGDPSRTDGKLKLCVENLDGREGLWTRAAYQEAVAMTPPGQGKQAPPSAKTWPSSPATKTMAAASEPSDTSWCEGARALGSAPAGYALPFSGYMIITNGPGEGMHTGSSSQAVDYAPLGGAPWTVLAAAAGTVVDATTDESQTGGFGKLLRIEHADGRISFYAHLDSISVSDGETVSAGQAVATAGNTGNGAGYHLHFEVRSGWNEDSVFSGSSVDIRGIPGTWWCEWYPPGDPDKYSGYADTSGVGPPGDSAGVDDARYAGEGDPPDDTVFAPGSTFTKTWTLLNAGTTTWDPYAYQAVNTTNSFGPSLLRLSGDVAPETLVDIGGNFTVPVTPGTYKEIYRMQGPNGTFGDEFWIQIVVSETGIDDAELVTETAPDPGTVYAAGDTFSKSWTLRNTGTSVWTTGYYRATRTSGVFGPAYLTLPEEVTPDETIKLTGTFTAPTVPGTYLATFQMQGFDGTFGDEFSVEIEVLGSAPGGASSPIYEVGLDMYDPDCPGGYLEIDGFGGLVPWIVVVASYAGDPSTGDLCSGHGPDPECGHNQTNPECGTARIKVTATMDYPDEAEPICSFRADSRPGIPAGAWRLGLLLCLPVMRYRRRARRA